jgi:hypothetical protein
MTTLLRIVFAPITLAVYVVRFTEWLLLDLGSPIEVSKYRLREPLRSFLGF